MNKLLLMQRLNFEKLSVGAIVLAGVVAGSFILRSHKQIKKANAIASFAARGLSERAECVSDYSVRIRRNDGSRMLIRNNEYVKHHNGGEVRVTLGSSSLSINNREVVFTGYGSNGTVFRSQRVTIELPSCE